MMRRSTARSLAGIAAGLGLVAAATTSSLAASPSPAAASPASLLAQVKAHAAEAVNDREHNLEALADTIGKAKDITPDHRAALLSLVHADETGLTQLNQQIQADTTLADAVRDARRIVTDYRVYVLVDPKTHIVIGADTVSAVDVKLHSVSDWLRDAINEAKVGDDRKEAARAKLEDFNENVAAADHDVDGLSAAMLALTAQGYPGNRPQLASGRDRLRDARSHLARARADVQAIEALIKA